MTRDESYPYVIHLGIEQIGTVFGGVHPLAIDLRRGRANRCAFRNQAEVRSGAAGSLCKSRLTIKLILDRLFGDHTQAVLAGSLSERRVPLQCTCPSFGACVIDQLYDLPSLWRNRDWIPFCEPACAKSMDAISIGLALTMLPKAPRSVLKLSSSRLATQRSLSVVSAKSAKTSAPIQKRTITFDSDQPISSKWWCRGAILKMRFLRSL